MSSRTKFAVVMPSPCLVALLLLGGVVTKSSAADDAAASGASVYKHLAVYSEVLSRIKSEYVEEPDMSNVTLGALNGLLESIDPYASYLNAEQYKEYQKNFDAYKGDVGLVLAKKFGYVTVISSIPGSPAAEAGLTTGDMLESIKGIATRDMPIAFARLLLKGAPGSTIELSVLRRKPEPQKLTLTRVAIAVPAIESKMMPENVGYIKVPAMSPAKSTEVAAAVAALTKQGAKRLLLDLRYCASGSAEDGIDLANLFLDKGTITYTQGQKSPKKTFEADAKKDVSALPLVILVNRGTASGAELAAAALAGNKRATLVGERTYGDASILKPITMDDGSAIILSIAKYYTPEGKSIQDNGVTPETLVADTESEAEVEEETDGAPAPAKKPSTEDMILKKGLEVVMKKG